MSQPMRNALSDYLINGGEQQHAAQRHGVSANGLNQRVTMARRVIREAYTLVTGEQPQAKGSE